MSSAYVCFVVMRTVFNLTILYKVRIQMKGKSAALCLTACYCKDFVSIEHTATRDMIFNSLNWIVCNLNLFIKTSMV